VIAALSTGHKTGLIAVAAVFIVFALVSSFVLPRRDPDFPGKRMGAFIAATVLLFAAMLAAVVIFGSEPKEAERLSGTNPETQTVTTTKSGDPANGKLLFTAKSCAGCHSLDGSFITGPSLKGVAGTEVTLADGSKVTADDAYLLESIEDPGKQVVKCPNCGPPSPMATVIPKGSITPAQAADLVAYIKTQK
jgi:mono/diheme cytochrome c family protein